MNEYFPKSQQINLFTRIFRRIGYTKNPEIPNHNFYYKDTPEVKESNHWVPLLASDDYLFDRDRHPPQWIDRRVLEQAFNDAQQYAPGLMGNDPTKFDMYDMQPNIKRDPGHIAFSKYQKLIGTGMEIMDFYGVYCSEHTNNRLTQEYVEGYWTHASTEGQLEADRIDTLVGLGFDRKDVNKRLTSIHYVLNPHKTKFLEPYEVAPFKRVQKEFWEVYSERGRFALNGSKVVRNPYLPKVSQFLLDKSSRRALDTGILLAPSAGKLPTHCPITDQPLDWSGDNTLYSAVITRKEVGEDPIGKNLMVASRIARVCIERVAYLQENQCKANNFDLCTTEEFLIALCATYDALAAKGYTDVPSIRHFLFGNKDLLRINGYSADKVRTMLAPPLKFPVPVNRHQAAKGTPAPSAPRVQLSALDPLDPFAFAMGEGPPSSPSPEPPPAPEEPPPRASSATPSPLPQGHPVPLPQSGNWRRTS